MSFSRLDYAQPALTAQDLAHLESDLTMGNWISADRVKTLLLDYLRMIDNEALDDAYSDGYEAGLEECQAEYERGREEGYNEGWEAAQEDAKR